MSVHAGPTNANGHRRRQLVARVKAEEDYCALCGGIVDKSLGMIAGEHGPRCAKPECAGCVPHPMRGEVDEDLPRARGGSPLERANVALMHRSCNQEKGTRTIEEELARRAGTTAQSAAVITNLVEW
ncbi:hypothetical protein [Gulosibacter macacae]|uniref:hypothetical protein n=1 Tax=Gulosibacter macacae TaxID=2488791 RepID=UPI00163B1432|nr:hypothetical protein [Gulosibacter macacae]